MEVARIRQPPFDPFGLVLRSAHSMLNTIASKPFLTSVDKVLTCLLATTTKICTIAWSRQDHSLSPSHQQHAVISMRHTCLHVESSTNLVLRLIICLYTCSAINFQGYCICQVSCYTLLSRFHSMATVLVSSYNNTFCGIWWVYNRAHLNQLSVHPASHILLTKKCPQIEKRICTSSVTKVRWHSTPI